MSHLQMCIRSCLFLAATLMVAASSRGAEPIEGFLQTHCIRCHGPDKAKGDLRLDSLSRDFKSDIDSHHWSEAIEKVNSGEMPPKKEKKPTQEEIATFVTDL